MVDADESGKHEQDDSMDYENFLKYRETLSNLAAEQSRSFDKHLIALASGGIGVSVLLLKDVFAGRSIEYTYWLYDAWMLFCFSLFLTLVSFQIAKMACDKEIKKWDALYRRLSDGNTAVPQNKFTRLTTALNWISLVLFGLALGALVRFGILNVK